MKLLLNQRFGLGNQFFQYAAAMYFSQKYGAEVELIFQIEETQNSYGHPRPFLLSHYNISAPIRARTVLDRVLRSKSAIAAALAKPVRTLAGVYQHDPNFLIVGTYQSALPIPKGTRLLYLNGHFQVHQYAQALEPQLRREFTLRNPPTGKNLEMLQLIQSSACPVSMHVRLGDYTAEWNGRNLLPAEYYRAAIAQMLKLHPDAQFFVFSDDIAGARARLPDIGSAVFVDINSEAEPHEDLRLIAACRHHILANSTFSWWGAWLNPNPGKTVLVPDPWHVTDLHPDLLPPEWRKIQR